MLKHYLVLAYRNFKQNKGSFFINLAGLSTGLACALFIYLWVNDELSVDKFHKHDKNLYQVMLNHEESGTLRTGPDTQALLAEAMANELPEVKMAVEDTEESWFADSFTLTTGDMRAKLRGKFSGKSYFEMFSFDLIYGSPDYVLADKNSIVISEKAALSLFNTIENVVGKSIHWRLLHFSGEATVTGIFKNVPHNSTEDFDFVLSFAAFKEMLGNDRIHWGNYNAYTYVLLRDDVDAGLFNEKIGDFVKKRADWSNVNLFVTPYSDRYLYGKYENGIQIGGRISYVRLFIVIAIFILALACINFMNLSTSRASQRMREIGVKKAIGATRKGLTVQYLGESIVLVLISQIVAVALVFLLLPVFNQITGKQLSLHFSGELVATLLIIAVITGIFAGAYPALFLSGFRPIAVLKGKLPSSFGELWLRRGLVVFQFVVSIVLIVSVLVVYKQIEYLQTKNLGYQRDNVIILPGEGKAVEKTEAFLKELRKIPNVLDATASNHDLLTSGNYTTDLRWTGKDPDENTKFEVIQAHYGFIETLGIEIKEGRTFSEKFGFERDKLIFNEAAIKAMGLSDPVGKTVNLWGEDRQIIGIVKDFHIHSLHEKVGPLFFGLVDKNLQYVMVKIKGGRERETLDQINRFYKDFNPGFVFTYKFLDQEYQAQYVAEQRVSALSRYFAGLAILISCLGLFGLATFTAEKRLKEISIRKVLGSSEFGIVKILSTDFTQPVVISIFIGLPLSYLLVNYWLKDFAYHMQLKWWYFAGTGVVTLLIAWFTVGVQTVKAAMVNPADSLRNEG